MSDLQNFGAAWLPAIEAHMRSVLSGERSEARGMWSMMRYHMGWEDAQGRPDSAPQGKRIRPLVVLMACQAAGGDTASALPAAAAVELLHNFSLIHDDIEDDSPTRRHRPTLWTWAGVPQAINAGDAMFTLARISLGGLSERDVPAARVLQALRVFDTTCLRLTEGQYLDMSFETRAVVNVETYLAMIAGKTAALLAACAQLGAIVATDDAAAWEHFWRFGQEVGLSFQIQDDILGIWGDEAQTGKSAASDLLTRKKTLPVLYALAQPGAAGDDLRALYARSEPFTSADLPVLLDLLSHVGARRYATERAEIHAQNALAALAAAGDEQATALLRALALNLLGRNS